MQRLEAALKQHAYLLGETASIADVAIFPFMRQFSAVDAAWFAASDYVKLRAWLEGWVSGALFEKIMQKR